MNVHRHSVGHADLDCKTLVGPAGTDSEEAVPQPDMADPKKVGQRIKSLRRQSGQTQSEVAEAIGVARSTYAEMENGTDRGGLDSILAVADYFKVPLDWLLHRVPPPGGPLVGYFTDIPNELAWLELWRAMDDHERAAILRLLKRGTASGRSVG
jgi:transcriptional regulator with XRE-family HTH domain